MQVAEEHERLAPGASTLCVHARCRQREAEAEEERKIAEYMRQRREREAQEQARKSSKREAMDRWGEAGCSWCLCLCCPSTHTVWLLLFAY